MTARFSVPRIWDGQTVVIVGGGPSLTFDQIRLIARSRLEDRCRVIAVNDQIYFCWWADWLHGCDAKWWNWHKASAPQFTGIKTTLEPNTNQEWGLGWLENTGVEGFDGDPTHVRTGRNGAYQAMHCAIHAGAATIVLVGVDMRDAGERTHCHSGHPRMGSPSYEKRMVPVFRTLLPALEERGIRVWNCSKRSAIDCFDKIDLAKLIGGQ